MSELIKVSEDNGNFIIKLGNRIDTSNATEIQEEILNEIKAIDKDTHLILDCDNLNYISSAGLRMVMFLLREHPNMELIDVGPNPYDIFEVTGFADVVPITRKNESQD